MLFTNLNNDFNLLLLYVIDPLNLVAHKLQFKAD